MSRLVGVDRSRKFSNFRTPFGGRRFELSAFWTAGPSLTRATSIDECAWVLFDESFHYDCSGSERSNANIACNRPRGAVFYNFIDNCF